MNSLWLLLLLSHAASAQKLTKEENEKLKKTCGFVTSPARVKRREPVSHSDYPFAAALSQIIYGRDHMTGKLVEEHTNPICSGVLISPRHILTAAHCLYKNFITSCTLGLPPKELPARNIGTFLSNCYDAHCWGDKKVYKSTSVNLHKDFITCVKDASMDIAVIELKENVEKTPICMPEADSVISDKEKIQSIGFGKVGGRYNMQSVGYNHFRERRNEIIAYNKTSESSGSAATYGGDSGGPLVQKVEGRHYLFGILSMFGIFNLTYYRPRVAVQVEGAVIFNDPVTISDHYYKVECAGSRFSDVRKHLTWICRKTGVCPLSGTVNDEESIPSLPLPKHLME